MLERLAQKTGRKPYAEREMSREIATDSVFPLLMSFSDGCWGYDGAGIMEIRQIFSSRLSLKKSQSVVQTIDVKTKKVDDICAF
jgi:hypothetical protein